jgi:hypothetical protein
MGTPGFPIVLKVSHAHAGYGKVKVPNHKDFEDMRGLVALHKYAEVFRSFHDPAHCDPVYLVQLGKIIAPQSHF